VELAGKKCKFGGSKKKNVIVHRTEKGEEGPGSTHSGEERKKQQRIRREIRPNSQTGETSVERKSDKTPMVKRKTRKRGSCTLRKGQKKELVKKNYAFLLIPSWSDGTEIEDEALQTVQ